ncbi:MAG: LysR family transcriptional regulator [Candidatus Competibacteraceae bacterium]|nr:LysR family transcriptional regulator [Candidatus Competibacteraceae bacterium]
MYDIDTSLLRTFVVLAETRSFTKTAERIGRTQSATSMQIRKLEDLIGAPLFKRDNRNVEVTAAGERLLGNARHIVGLCEALLLRFRETEVEGEVRFGAPEDYTTHYLPDILADFMASHPRIMLNVNCDLTLKLIEGFEAGDYDMVVIKQEPGKIYPHAEPLWRERLVWVGSTGTFEGVRHFETIRRDFQQIHQPLPLVLAPAPCVYRRRALETLDAVGMPWKVVYTSPSLAGTTAAVKAGLGITVLPRNMVPDSLTPYEAEQHWPLINDAEICLLSAGSTATPATRTLATFIRENVSFNKKN